MSRSVYVLLEAGSVVYVGQAGHPPARIGQHARRFAFSGVVLVPVERSALDLVERALIRLFDPPRNTAGRLSPAYGPAPLPSADAAVLDALGVHSLEDILELRLAAPFAREQIPAWVQDVTQPETCWLPGCGRVAYARRGLCEAHLTRARIASRRGRAPSREPVGACEHAGAEPTMERP